MGRKTFPVKILPFRYNDLKNQTRINDKKESFITLRVITSRANPTSHLLRFWEEGVNIRASAGGLLDGVQKISIRKKKKKSYYFKQKHLIDSIFLIYLVNILGVPVSLKRRLDGMYNRRFGH